MTLTFQSLKYMQSLTRNSHIRLNRYQISDFARGVQSHPTHFAADNRLVQRLQSSVCPCLVPPHGTVQFVIIRSIRLVGHIFFPKLPLLLWVSSPPQHTVPRAKPTHHSKRHLDWFRRFCVGPNAVLHNALSLGKTRKIAPSLGISSLCQCVKATESSY